MQLVKLVAFGLSKAGLSTVAYQLYNYDGTPNGSQVSSGIVELQGGGQYGALVTFPDSFQGFISWTSGEVSPVYASEDVDLVSEANIDASSTQLQAIRNKTDLITVEAVTVSSPVYKRGDFIIIERGSTLVIPITGLGSMAGRDRWLVGSAKDAEIVIAAWGRDGQFSGRDLEVEKILDDLQCLGENKDGTPKHPLYLRDTTHPQTYNMKEPF